MNRFSHGLTVCFPSPLVGEGSSASSRSDGNDGKALREGGLMRDAAKLLTPLRKRNALACSPTRGERESVQ
jgi:hypothetical protein